MAKSTWSLFAFLILASTVNSQEVGISIVGEIEKSKTALSVRAKLDKEFILRSNPYERTLLITPDEVNFYAVREAKGSCVVLSYNKEEKKYVDAIFPEKEGFKHLHFVGATYFQKEILVFFEGISSEIDKKHKGLFVSSYNQRSNDYGPLKLIAQVDKSIDGFQRSIITQSESGNFLALVTNPDVNCVEKNFYAVVLNKSLAIEYDHNLSLDVEECEFFKNLSLTDNGQLHMFFASSKLSNSNNAITEYDYINNLIIDKEGKRKEVKIALEGRILSDVQLMNSNDNEPYYFVSWIDEDEDSIKGLSILKGDSLVESFKTSFDASFLEPYINESFDKFQDVAKKRGANNKNFNCLLSLDCAIEKDGFTFLFLEKRAPIIIKLPATLINASINKAYSGNFGKNIYTSFNSDIIILKLKEGELISQHKLERELLGEKYSNDISYNVDGNIVSFFYNSKKIDKLPDYLHYLLEDNFAFYHSTYDLKTDEINTTELYQLSDSDDENGIKLELGNNQENGKNFYSLGEKNHSFYIMKIDLK